MFKKITLLTLAVLISTVSSALLAHDDCASCCSGTGNDSSCDQDDHETCPYCHLSAAECTCNEDTE